MLPFLTFCCQCVCATLMGICHPYMKALIAALWSSLRGTNQVPEEINTHYMLLYLPPLFQAVQSIELLWNVCVMTSACFFSHPVAHCVCLLPKPGPLEAILLLFAWRQSHASRWVFFMSCFWTENTWARRLWIPHCLTEQRVQLRQGAHVHLLSVEGWGYILSVYSQNGCIFSWWNEG